MASTINADNGVISGSAGLKSTADSSGVLGLQANGTTVATISGGAVTINGATGAGAPLTLTTTDAGANTQAVFQGGRTFQIGTGNASSGFANNLFVYDGTASATVLQQGRSTYSLALQGASPVAGTGISFPATQNASSDANTLDDYEEGTWTPAVSGLTFSTARGTYTKVGNLCYCTIEMSGSNTSKTSTDIYITGFPFTSNATYDFAAVSVPFTEVNNITLGTISATPCILMYGRIPISVTYMQLLQTTGKAHDAFTAGGGLSTGAVLRTSFCYRTA